MTGDKKGRKPSNKRTGPEVLESIGAKASILLHPQVTLTCYIPTHCVGAVIGRRGSTIVQIQKHAQQVGGSAGPVRVSIVGHDESEEQLPYTYSDLDWSSPHWTPVVIRADPCGALAAAQRLQDIVEELDEVVLDIPLSRTKHFCLIGKRGLVLANLSADTQVRIMIPRRELRHDVVQLEGDLPNVQTCLEKILCLASNDRKANPKPNQGIVNVSVLPSQTKLRNVGRKTETVIKKKKLEGDEWQLIVTGNNTEQVQAAVGLLEKWHEDKNSESPQPNRQPGRGGGRGRGPQRSKPKGKNNNNNNKPKGQATNEPS